MLGTRLDRCIRGAFRRRFEGLGDRSRGERKPWRSMLAKARADLLGAALQLERPDRVRRVDVERPVAREPGRPGIACNYVADGERPRFDDGRHPRRRPEATELSTDGIANAFHQAARTSPGVTSSRSAGSTGSDDAWVAVTSVWPAP